MSKIAPVSSGTSAFVFDGFALPRYTTVPDEVFDVLMAQLSGAELKVLLYIIRRTFGFKKEADSISVAQMCNGIRRSDGSSLDTGTGLSRQSVITAVRSLEAMGIIVARRNSSAAHGDEATTYSLRFAHTAGESIPQYVAPLSEESKQATGGSLENRPGGIKKPDRLGSKNMAGGVKNHDPQQTALQHTHKQHNLSNDSMETQPPQITVPDKEKHEDYSQQFDSHLESGLSSATTRKAENISITIDNYITDYSRELGDTTHICPNCVRARRLWQKSGLSESAFCAALHQARQRVRERQMLAGGVHNRMAYFFGVLEQCCGLRPSLPTTIQAQSEVQHLPVESAATAPSWWVAYGSRYSQTG